MELALEPDNPFLALDQMLRDLKLAFDLTQMLADQERELFSLVNLLALVPLPDKGKQGLEGMKWAMERIQLRLTH